MVFDLAASHPSLSSSSYPPSQSQSPAILDYPSFLKQQQQQQQQKPNNVVPTNESIYPSPYSSSNARHYGSEMDLFPNQPNPFWQHQQPQGQRSHCLSVQQHVSECSICRNYILWQQWNAISHWVVIGLIVIYFFRTSTPRP